jgi:hypothetical protein
MSLRSNIGSFVIGFSAYTIRNYESDPNLSLSENAWKLFDNGNILDRNSVWSPLLGFWVAGNYLDVFFLSLYSCH